MKARVLAKALVGAAVRPLQADAEVAVAQEPLGDVRRAQRHDVAAALDHPEGEVVPRPLLARELAEEVAMTDVVAGGC